MPRHQSGRLELAQWITNNTHPLTARGMSIDCGVALWKFTGGIDGKLWSAGGQADASRVARLAGQKKLYESGWSNNSFIA